MEKIIFKIQLSYQHQIRSDFSTKVKNPVEIWVCYSNCEADYLSEFYSGCQIASRESRGISNFVTAD